MKYFAFCCLFAISVGAKDFVGESGGFIAIPVTGETTTMPTFSTNGQKFHLYGLPYVDVQTELSIFDSKITVNPVDFGESRITITNTGLVTPSAEDQKRSAQESKQLRSVLSRKSNLTAHSVDFLRPVTGVITSRYGKKRFINDLPRAPQLALDLDGEIGDPIIAPLDGKVILVDNFFYAGNFIVLDHGSSIFTSYSHMHSTDVVVGQYVTKGEKIGTVGSTGRVTGPHLHWTVYFNGNRVNPEKLREDGFIDTLVGENPE